MLAKALQGLIGVASTVAVGLLGLLPSSPFEWQSVSWPEYLQVVGWLIPWESILAHTEAWLVAVAGWYAVRIALRWIKAVE